MTECPKCGSDAGWDGPKYQVTYGTYLSGGAHSTVIPGSEYLKFTCQSCGYERWEPTKDAPPGPPPPPDPSTDPGRVISNTGGSWWNWLKG